MNSNKSVTVFWFRRDLRLDDNVALNKALCSEYDVLPIFIFDQEILDKLPRNDARVSFIHEQLENIDKILKEQGSSILVKQGKPIEVWKALVDEFSIKKVFFNKDYEPYALKRDREIIAFLQEHNIVSGSFKDQVIFETNEILKDDGEPYTIYTPYKNKWLENFKQVQKNMIDDTLQFSNFYKYTSDFPGIDTIGFEKSKIKVPEYHLEVIENYDKHRDYPSKTGTSHLSPHLRFGTVSIRKLVRLAQKKNEVFLSELIWREFFMQILFHFPEVVTHNFKRKYDGIKWRNNETEFKKWCNGETGYPMVDAGMRELNQTGYMHNRVRMITASFLCKHLLIDWRWGEAYFAEKLLDYDLASNNGNWQWAAGTGCDAAPYFRIFNPESQQKKFDKDLKYIKKWIKDYGESTYPKPMVDHKMDRERALRAYKIGIQI